MTTFTRIPDQGATETHSPRRRVVQFGDGYIQVSADGINQDLPTWELSFGVLTASESEDIMALFATDGAGGTIPLTWTPPSSSTPIKVLAYPYKRVQQGPDNFTITATFTQVPG